MEYTSSVLENAVSEMAKLPGVGRRTALRFALHILKQDELYATSLAQSILKLRTEIRYCIECNNLSDTDYCTVCSDSMRNHSVICVVENIRDVMAIEATGQYRGVYHVLGGVISPINGVGVNDIKISDLVKRVKENDVEEIILALPTTMEGDTTSFYINRLLEDTRVKISAIARGVAIGDNIEYADEQTLGRSIVNRQPFQDIYKR